jgi:hypothetical protein
MIQATAVCHRLVCCCQHERDLTNHSKLAYVIHAIQRCLCQNLLHCTTRDSGPLNCPQHRTADIIFPTQKSPEIDKQATDSIFHFISDSVLPSLLTDSVYSHFSSRTMLGALINEKLMTS